MTKRTEIAIAAVVGAVISVFVAQAADVAGLLVFTIVVAGMIAAVAMALVIRRLLERRNASREHRVTMERLLVQVSVDLNELKAREIEKASRLREDLAALRKTQGDDQARVTKMLGETTSVLRDLLEDGRQTRQLVLPDWLRRAQAWAEKEGWTVTYKGCAVVFSRQNEPDRTARIILPLGSHQEEEATRAQLHKHLGYPERATLRGQIVRASRALGRGSPT